MLWLFYSETTKLFQNKLSVRTWAVLFTQVSQVCVCTSYQKAKVVTKNEKVENEASMDKNSAAVMIQKQYRGYSARKKYMELHGAQADVMDIKTAEFISKYWNKWKVKTIFQVLLMYRAAKHQDLIYFSQQVHIYNQKAVEELIHSGLENVDINKIDPGGKASHVLPTKSPCVWKLPFRLNEVPYFDTMYMCNEPNTLLFDADEDAWDAPLKRGKDTTSKPNMKDEEVQTTMTPPQKRKLFTTSLSCTEMNFVRDVDRITDEGNFIPEKESSFIADHNDLVPEEKFSFTSNEENFMPQKEPCFSSIEFSDDSRKKQSTENKYIKNGKELGKSVPNVNVYKAKRNLVATEVNSRSNIFPVTNTTHGGVYFNDNEIHKLIDKENNQMKTYVTSPTDNSSYIGVLQKNKNNYNKKILPRIQDDKNPIIEMKMRGQRISSTTRNNKNTEDEADEPPFNFQAMLRKTNNRKSLKRNNEQLEETNKNSPASVNLEPVPDNMRNETEVSRPANVVYYSNIKKSEVSSSFFPSTDFTKKTCKEQILEEDDMENVFAPLSELAPGLVIQGQVSDL